MLGRLYFVLGFWLQIISAATAWQPGRHRRPSVSLKTRNTNHEMPNPNIHQDLSRSKNPRRLLLQQALAVVATTTTAAPAAHAGEVGARITRAVTQSDLGISVRRSVVKGAQTMDGLDGQWEKFSDKYGLGANRQGAGGRPAPKVIPEAKPLDNQSALALLQIANQAFLQCSLVNKADLEQQIRRVQATVAPSFVRSGLEMGDWVTTATTAVLNRNKQTIQQQELNAEQFNFLCYSHFKAYSDLIIERKIDFRQFKTKFEEQVGKQTADLLLPSSTSAVARGGIANNDNKPALLQQQLQTAQTQIQDLSQQFVQRGLVAQIDASPLAPDQILDWAQDLSDLQWSIALDGDATQNCQILLQEQGFRLYPNFCRYAVQHVLTTVLPANEQSLEITDYFMDTDYNSDPDLFSVKEILLNVVLESRT